MCLFMWHKDQQSVSYTSAIVLLHKIQAWTESRPLKTGMLVA